MIHLHEYKYIQEVGKQTERCVCVTSLSTLVIVPEEMNRGNGSFCTNIAVLIGVMVQNQRSKLRPKLFIITV